MRTLTLALLAATLASAESPLPLKARFDRAGVAGIPAAELRKHWPDWKPAGLSVSLGGAELPWCFEKDTVLFPVTRPGTVWLRPAGAAPSVADPADLTQAGPPSRVPRTVTRFEENRVFDRLETARLGLMDTTDAPFYWMPVSDGAELHFEAEGRRKTTKIRVRLQPMRTERVEHRIAVELNGKPLGEAAWEGGRPHTAEFEADLEDGAQTLTFRTADKPVARVIASGPIGTGPPAYVDWIEIDGPAIAAGPQAAWTGDRATAVMLAGKTTESLDVVFALDRRARIAGSPKAVAEEGPVMAASWKGLLRPASLEAALPAFAPDAGIEWVAIGPEAFRAALAPLVAYRRAQGLAAAFVPLEQVRDAAGSDGPAADAVRAFLRASKDWPEPKLRYVLLAGDASRNSEAGLPCALRDALGAGWTATDGYAAQLDDDDLPDLALGRWPARTPEEAGALLAKVKRLEEAPPGEWRRRLHLVLGTAGFGAALDGMLKTGGMKMASDFVPDAYAFRVQSTLELDLPFTYPHDEYNALLTQRVNDGCLVLAYSGHGWEHGVQSLKWGGKRFPILDCELAGAFDVKHGLPVAFLFACLTGSFDEEKDCLAESLARNPGGPAAVVASSGISHPYADMIFAKELMSAMFARRAPTIGLAVKAAKQRALKPLDDDAMRKFIDGMAAGTVGGPEMQARFRLDGSLAYNLIGDPATRMPWPKKAKLAAAKAAAPGTELAVEGTAELGDGTAFVTLEAERLKSVEPLEKVDREAKDFDRVLKRNWKRMNEAVAAEAEVAMKGGAFAATLTIPGKLREGTYLLKVYANDGKSDAIASRKVKIEAVEK